MNDDVAKKVEEGIARDIGPVEPVPKWSDRACGIALGIVRREEGSISDLVAMALLADKYEAMMQAKKGKP